MVCVMVLILDGNSEIGAHVRSNFNSIYLLKTFDWTFFSEKTSYPLYMRNMFCVTS